MSRSAHAALLLAVPVVLVPSARASELLPTLYPVPQVRSITLTFPSNLDSLALGDWNGDGREDVLAGRYESDEIAVFLATGPGTFAARSTIPAGDGPISVAAADMNGDGHRDAIVANRWSSDVGVLLGDGTGGFGAMARFPFATPITALDVLARDLDLDGDVDVAVTHAYEAEISVFLGDGGGGLGPPLVIPVGSWAAALKARDLDGDGRPDLAAVDRASGNVWILFGLSGGGFAPPQAWPAPGLLTDLAVGDLTADGRNDFIALAANSTLAYVYVANPAGGFSSVGSFAVAAGSSFLALGDVDGDLVPDLCASGGGFVSVLRGRGDGTFAARIDFPINGTRLVVRDLDADGHADLLTLRGPSLALILSDGNGGFVTSSTFGTGISLLSGFVSADSTGDGALDLVLCDRNQRLVKTFLGDGSGGFLPGNVLTFETLVPGQLASGDIDGDGAADFALSSSTSSTYLLQGTPQGVRWWGFVDMGEAGSSLLARLDGDSWVDLATANRSANTVRVRSGNGTSAFGPATIHATGSEPVALAAGDVDGDTVTDLVVALGAGQGVSILRGDGLGGFLPRTDWSLGAVAHSVELSDLDGDGDLDIAAGTTTRATVLWNDGHGVYGAPAGLGPIIGPHTLRVRDLDRDGRPDLARATTTSFVTMRNEGSGSFGGPFEFAGGGLFWSIADFDGDGWPDLAGASNATMLVSASLGPDFDAAGFCFGDGSGTACPCGNDSAPGAAAGCLHSFGDAGALELTGVPSVAFDSAVLVGRGMTNSTALYFQGTLPTGGGIGSTFGDGLRCVAGSLVRLGTKTNVSASSRYPESGDVAISIRGLIPATGGTRHYQVWYRNAASYCTSATFNLTNAVRVEWAP